MTPPSALVLEYELLHNQIRKILWLHSTDRWYLGDFLRHVNWISALSDIQNATLDLASNIDYLSLFETDSRVNDLYDVRDLSDENIAVYDLIIIPSSFGPTEYNPSIKRALYYWDRGWEYVRYGTVIASGTKQGLNYFTGALHAYGETGLPYAEPVDLMLPVEAVEKSRNAVRALFGNQSPTIIYNPTASNPYTRQTDIKKEVENILTAQEHAVIIRQVREELPQHNVLIASAMREGDAMNRAATIDLKSFFTTDENVKTIFDMPEARTTIRDFAILLSSKTIVGMVGTATGTNTHLAAKVATPSFSIERAADDIMKENWSQPHTFQMGSFRWRNPSPLVATYNLDWHAKSEKDFEIIGGLFCNFLRSFTDKTVVFAPAKGAAEARAGIFLAACQDNDAQKVLETAQSFLATLNDDLMPYYGDFTDEAAYLGLVTGGSELRTLQDILLRKDVLEARNDMIVNLIKDSMLFKLARRTAGDVPKAAPKDTADILFRKIRANAPLDTTDREVLQCTPQELQVWLNGVTSRHARTLCDEAAGNGIQTGWQHVVYPVHEVMVKDLATNPASEYLTDERTLKSINVALDRAGGLVPHSSRLIGTKFASERLVTFLKSGEETMSDTFSGEKMAEYSLAPGWVNEQFENYKSLIEQGAFNFDIKFKDLGIDNCGVLKVADFSECKALEQNSSGFQANLRTDLFHMGINELIRNGQFLLRFANGRILAEHYSSLVETGIGIDLRPHYETWQWGDHGSAHITPLAQKLKAFIEKNTLTTEVRPVYPVFDTESAAVIYRHLVQKLG